ncbi:unnamed protein product [Dracunculus medinensis]|uniref:SH3 domain-containing protein n=1 Tax=Dracunculus medinensis TaxID=318479 RepID=A0A0N4UE36_DRAME|nr:unnamed protein product [Dracunculus medinensis]
MADDDVGLISLRCLIETEIPESRANLENSYTNLERVAAYCEANYAQAMDKKAAFNETRQYTIQSLASVAYQVNTLAYALLQTLQLQADKIEKMSSQVHNVGEVIAIHKEKVARREIGVLTVNKYIHKQPKIIAPLTQERIPRYQRTAIDYSVLDNVGHGAKSVEPPVKIGSRTVSITSGYSSGNHPVFPNYEQLLPKANINTTLSRSSTARGDHYRTPQAAATPLIDPQRFSTVTQAMNYTSGTNISNYGSAGLHIDSQNLPLPPPQLASVEQYRISDGMMQSANVILDEEPLPSPPPNTNMSPLFENVKHTHMAVPISEHSDSSHSPYIKQYECIREWAPKTYLEKAIALYDYEAEKPDELTLRENCIVYILRKNEDGWFEGVLDGCTGLFPGNYVQRI